MISRLVMIGLVCSHVLLELIVEPISKVAADSSSAMPIEYGSEPALIGKKILVLHTDTTALYGSDGYLHKFLRESGSINK